jgi:opacity protein-like surface antigen
MNSVMKLLQILLVLGVAEIHAQNIGDVFGGISYIQTSIKDESSTNLGTFKPTVVGLGLAYVVMDNIALEANAFNGDKDSSNSPKANYTYTVKIKNGYSLGVRPFMAFNETWGGYAKLGRQYGEQTTVVKYGAKTLSDKSSTYANTFYGLGISYNINPKWGISSEYMWSKKGNSETSNTTVGVGLRYKF